MNARLGSVAVVAVVLIACGTGSANPTQEASSSPAPTPLPTASTLPATPTPTFTTDPSPSLTQTPPATTTPAPPPTPTLAPIPSTQDVDEIVEALAPTGSTLSSDSGDVRITYSQAVLDNAGIVSLSVATSVMNRAERVMFEEAYASVNQRVGSRITFVDSRTGNLMRVNSIVSIVGHCLMPDQFYRMREALERNQVPFVSPLHVSGLIVNQGGGELHVLIRADPTFGLAQAPERLARLDSQTFGNAVSADGPIRTLGTLGEGAEQAKYAHEPYSIQYDSDRLYEVFDSAKVQSGEYLIVRQ